ncbi:alpha/beta fold hydrolase [Amycolatopsis sp. NPDC059021]|uniref:alpha/beta fold hydrolase n=1 Tax=Amycolatopsis sp. NPDC059021 TaxID=3346704 RepID=UPI00366CCC41
MFKRTIVVAATALLGVSACSPAESHPAAPPPPDGLDDLVHQQLRWGACETDKLKEAGAECATAQVPMDYRQPHGEQITVAISRVKATDSQRRRGILMTNPGGPGGEGRSLASLLKGQPAAAVYDTIGIDPRGVGASTQLLCEPFNKPDLPSRPAEADLPRFTKAVQDEEAACARGGGELRRHVTSMNTARDMDLIRRVLGEEKINFLGISYGTFLGQLYGQMFPQHLDRMVLDSAQNPDTSWYQQEKDNVTAHGKNVAAWQQWVAERDSTFRLGATPAQVRATLDRFAGTLSQRELGALTDVTAFDNAVGKAARYRSMWAAFAWNLGDLLPALGGGPVDKDAATQIAALAKQSEDEHASASQAFRSQDKQAGKPNGTFAAITCDWPWPKNPQDYYPDMRRVSAEMPYGDTINSVAPSSCTFTSGRDPMIPVGPRQYPAGVVIQGEGDTQTAYPGGVAVADKLDIPLITVTDSGIHGYYPDRGNSCVNNLVNSYLIDGVLPPRRAVCAPVADKVQDIPVGAGPVSRKDTPSLEDIAGRVG